MALATVAFFALAGCAASPEETDESAGVIGAPPLECTVPPPGPEDPTRWSVAALAALFPSDLEFRTGGDGKEQVVYDVREITSRENERDDRGAASRVFAPCPAEMVTRETSAMCAYFLPEGLEVARRPCWASEWLAGGRDRRLHAFTWYFERRQNVRVIVLREGTKETVRFYRPKGSRERIASCERVVRDGGRSLGECTESPPPIGRRVMDFY